MLSTGFLPNYLLPDYEEVVTRPATPPPPYSALHTGPSSVVSSPLSCEPQERHCPAIQPTAAAPVSDGPCRPSVEEPQTPTLDLRPKPDNKPVQTTQDSGVVLLSDGLIRGGLSSQEKKSEGGEDTCKDLLLRNLSEGSAEDKDRLPNGRRRRFTGDSGIEVCVCGTRGSSGCSGAEGSGQDGKESRELESLLGREGDGEGEEEEEEAAEFCESCVFRASFSMEEEQVLGGLESQAAHSPPEASQPAHHGGTASLHPPVCLLLHTISEQEGPYHCTSNEPQGS